MSDERKHFLVVLDLSRFFCDHRRAARVFIKKNLKTIQDLQNRISEVFGVHGFYLSTGGQYLPVSEDIRVLNHGETVCVSPDSSDVIKNSTNTSSSELNTKGKKRRKRVLDETPEASRENSSTKKKKSERDHISLENLSSSSSEEEERCKKSKSKPNNVKENSLNFTKNASESSIIDNVNAFPQDVTPHLRKENNKQTKKERLVEKEVCNIESTQMISEIKKKLKRKADEYTQKNSDITAVTSPETLKTVLPKLRNHLKNCNNFGRSSVPDAVRLSRHVDTPIKTFTKYIPPQRSTNQYLAKTKVNIVKIDVIKENSLEVNNTTTDNSETKVENSAIDPNSPPENYVKTVINTFEKNISLKEETECTELNLNGTQNTSVEQKQNEASNYTKAYLDKDDLNTSTFSEIMTDQLNICSVPSTESPTSFKNTNNSNSSKTPDGNSNNSLDNQATMADISLDTSLLPQDVISFDCSALNLTNTSTESHNNDSAISKQIKATRLFSGVGSLIENLRESDSVVSQESDTSSSYVTKRKRTRKRKRQSEKNKNKQDVSLDFKSPLSTPITKNRPNTHIKFEDESIETTEEKMVIIESEVIQKESSIVDDEKNVEKPPVELIVLSDENEDPIMENKEIFAYENILKAPLMLNKLEPRLGDIIAFKILKMTENYTPHISNYIIGKVEMYDSDSKTIYFKILSGKEELSPVTGKLSLSPAETEDVQNSKYNEFTWSDILEAKLLYP